MKRSIWKRQGIQNFFDKNINWKNHIKEMITELSGACCAIRSVVHISNIKAVKSIDYANFHSVIKCGIIFGGNSSNSGKFFTLQKKIVKIMAGAQPRTSCKSLFKQSEILPVPCQYICSLTNFIFTTFMFILCILNNMSGSCLLCITHTLNQELHMQPHLPRFCQNNTLLYCILSF